MGRRHAPRLYATPQERWGSPRKGQSPRSPPLGDRGVSGSARSAVRTGRSGQHVVGGVWCHWSADGRSALRLCGDVRAGEPGLRHGPRCRPATCCWSMPPMARTVSRRGVERGAGHQALAGGASTGRRAADAAVRPHGGAACDRPGGRLRSHPVSGMRCTRKSNAQAGWSEGMARKLGARLRTAGSDWHTGDALPRAALAVSRRHGHQRHVAGHTGRRHAGAGPSHALHRTLAGAQSRRTDVRRRGTRRMDSLADASDGCPKTSHWCANAQAGHGARPFHAMQAVLARLGETHRGAAAPITRDRRLASTSDRQTRMRILICNDDGVRRTGLAHARKRRAARWTPDVWIVAPERKWTAASHQLTFDRDLDVDARRGERTYACSGAPADCVVAAMTVLLADGPEAQPRPFRHQRQVERRRGHRVFGDDGHRPGRGVLGRPGDQFFARRPRGDRATQADREALQSLLHALWAGRAGLGQWRGHWLCHQSAGRAAGAARTTARRPRQDRRVPATSFNRRSGLHHVSHSSWPTGYDRLPGDENACLAAGTIGVVRFGCWHMPGCACRERGPRRVAGRW